MAGKPELLLEGDHAPWFRAKLLSGSASYAFHTVAGRHVVLLFLGSVGRAASAAALRQVEHNRAMFDDERACLFGITIDPSDVAQRRIGQQLPGIRFFLDYDLAVSALYGAVADDGYMPQWLVLGPDLRIVKRFPINASEAVFALVRERVAAARNANGWAPVLLVPDVLEPVLCQELAASCASREGEESGFMREVDGKTVLVTDKHHKQRRDWPIEDEAMQRRLAECLRRRLVPALQRAFQFEATRIERYIIGCYEAGAGHFRPHRDNTTKGTAHRRFAVTINLNTGEYEGGDLRFPEFGDRTYRAPIGGATVFSCSLLHEAAPVTKGRRYAFLPFLYDEAGAKVREANLRFLDVPSSPRFQSTTSAR